MNITTKFNLADIVYLREDVILGKKIPLIVEKIRTTTEFVEKTDIVYQIANNERFHNEEAFEEDLLTYAEAKVIAVEELNEQIDEIDSEINNLWP